MSAERARLLFISPEDLSPSLQRLLADASLEVSHCRSALEGAARFVREPAGLVVVAAGDLEMSELEVIRLLRRESPTSFLLVTVSPTDRRKMLKALELGADAYLLEPSYPEELVSVLESALRRQRFWLEERLEEEKEKALARLSAGLSHEINNPLATLSGWVQMLLKNEDIDNSSRQALTNIKEAAERIAGVTRDLSALAGHILSERRPTELNHLLREVAAEVGLDEQAQCQLTDEELTVEVDEKLLKQALVDLLSSSAIGAEGDLRLMSLRQGGRALVSLYPVGRNGESGSLMELFDPFRAFAEGGMTEALKLSKSRGILHSFGGELRVKDHDSGQSAIEVELPLAHWK